ncbi:type IV pilin [Natronobeatus ordinarius]|uniref:type IV pilin n=1 Tax=Natronobeatus ordinarius TaxID=2963433 RepID=UPI0020CBD7BF|nr:type IV pilin N-terminal domain-containing protein [Natronobeatus ordinarius]
MNWTKKLVGNEEERAVSPVIGVILMVAITVILAAVIAAFVLDLGGGVDSEAQAGVEITQSQTDNTTTISATSMGNTEYIVFRGDVGNVSGTSYNPDDHRLERVGDSITLEYTAPDNGTITVVGVTEDGTETALTSEDFNFTD